LPGAMSNEPKFNIVLSREALKYYAKVSLNIAERLDKCFIVLESEPIKGLNRKLLKGMNGKYRYKVGGLRVIYQIELGKRVVSIIAILPRGQAYKKE
jgi:mRNA interferase RelE/StbE